MKPQRTRVWRKTRRHALRGVPTGRRATHQVQTAYGSGQKLAESVAAFSAFCAARREQTGDTTGDPACVSPWWHPDAGDLEFLYRDQMARKGTS